MRPFRSLLLGLSLALPFAASAATFYPHKSAVPVVVPGGTTTFFLDEVAPPGSTVVAESISVPKKTVVSFPTFIAPPFAAPATVGMAFLGTVHLSANLSMNGCANVSIVVSHVSASGLLTQVASGTAGGATVPQGMMAGTVGFAPVPVASAVTCNSRFSDLDVLAGESIAVSVSVFNNCKANRTVSLAYDAVSAPGNVVFSPLPPVDPAVIASCFAKCTNAKIKCAITKQAGLLLCEGKAAKVGFPVDPACVGKANEKFSTPGSGCMEKADSKPPCKTTGDAPTIGVKIDAFVADVKAELYANPVPTATNTCAAGKMKCVTSFVKGILTCESKAIKAALATADPVCLGKVMTKFTTPLKGCFDKLEQPGKACSFAGTTGDAPAIKAKAQAFMDDLVCELSPGSTFSILTTPGGGSCGSIDSASGAFASLTCGDLNIGDGTGMVPAGATPAGTTTRFNLASVSTLATSFPVCGRSPAQTGSNRNCSTVGCFFGSPLPVANGPLSTCVDNVFLAAASATLDPMVGSFIGDIPLQSNTTVTANASEPCPKCVSGMCDAAAANATAPCIADATSGESHDCMPAGPALPGFPVDLAGITTGTASATNAGGVFCLGQLNAGAFGVPSITSITANGSPAGDLTAGPALPATLASVFCIPATGNVLIDGSAGLPGPGETTLTVAADID